MKELAALLDRFREATGHTVVLWTREEPRPGSRLVARQGGNGIAAPPVIELLTPGGPAAEVEVPGGTLVVGAIASRERAWLGLGPVANGDLASARAHLSFLRPVVTHYLQSAMEVEHAAFELAARYEEINLLYATSEILGRTVSLEEAAGRILREISDTVNAQRAAILVHDRIADTLQVVSGIGFDPGRVPPIDTSDRESVVARVQRERHALIVEPGEMPCAREVLLRQGGLMAVPIHWTNPGSHDDLPVGVVTLSGRRLGEPFSSGDEKLVSAIATQIGTAIQNARLVRASLAQQRVQQEMQLANDLQMKLLPDPALFEPEARVAARVLPADSVGGDFYHLFRLGGGRTGVMIGDVSSHGYRAALVMALVMSAASIHAQSTPDPAEVLDALLGTLRDELESTEMFVSVFYAVIDPAGGRIRYANAGHPHAFVIAADGGVERLGALDPPLGMAPSPASARERPWDPRGDLLLLFTDGVPDARDRTDARLGEERVLDLARALPGADSSQIVEGVLRLLRRHMGDAPQRDDVTVLVARTACAA